MTRIYNKIEVKMKRQTLRNNMPLAEKLMWVRLKGKQVSNARFRRQYSVGSYILDFYCPALKLAVEIDGDSHSGDEAFIYDTQRQASIESMGIRFLRFTNAEVIYGIEEVLKVITNHVFELENLPIISIAESDPQPSFIPLTKGDHRGSIGTIGGRHAYSS
jgi:very-short-patch-repair endonuclease